MSKTRTICIVQSAPPRGPTQYDPQAFGNGENIVPGPAVFLSVIATNKSAGILWIMFFDAITIPGNGSIPIFVPLQVAANAQASLSLNDGQGGATLSGRPCTTGISWAVSTTPGTLTADASNSIWATVRYLG